MKSKFKKSITALLSATTLVVGIALGGFVQANLNLTEISAHLNHGITIMFNGESQTLRDAHGTTLSPITFNGSTYVPIRAVSEIFGHAVEWEGDTQTIWLGARERQPISLLSLPFTGTNHSWEIRESSQLTVPGSDAHATFSNGLIFHVWNNTMSTGRGRQITFNIPHGYTTLTFTAHAPRDTRVSLFDGDNNVITSFYVTADSITSRTIDITGITSLAIGGNAVRAIVGNRYYLSIFEPMLR